MMYPKSANGGPTSGSNAAGGPAGQNPGTASALAQNWSQLSQALEQIQYATATQGAGPVPNAQPTNNSGGVAGASGVAGVPPPVGFPPNAMQQQEGYDGNAVQMQHNL